MNQEFKKKWAAALRSGNYIQGNGYLHADGKYCCLGVACELAGIPGRPSERDDSKDVFYYGRSCSILLYDTRDIVGLKTATGKCKPYGYSDWTSLADLNDKGVKFKDIADIIEDPRTVWYDGESMA